MKTQIQKIVESILQNQDKSLLSEGGSKKFLDVKKQLKELGIHIHPTEGGEFRVVPQSDRKDPDKGYHTDDLDDALGTGKVMARKQYEPGGSKAKHDPRFDAISDKLSDMLGFKK